MYARGLFPRWLLEAFWVLMVGVVVGLVATRMTAVLCQWCIMMIMILWQHAS